MEHVVCVRVFKQWGCLMLCVCGCILPLKTKWHQSAKKAISWPEMWQTRVKGTFFLFFPPECILGEMPTVGLSLHVLSESTDGPLSSLIFRDDRRVWATMAPDPNLANAETS